MTPDIEPKQDELVSQLEKLVSLHASGALSDAEFDAAEARALGLPLAGANNNDSQDPEQQPQGQQRRPLRKNGRAAGRGARSRASGPMPKSARPVLSQPGRARTLSKPSKSGGCSARPAEGWGRRSFRLPTGSCSGKEGWRLTPTVPR